MFCLANQVELYDRPLKSYSILNQFSNTYVIGKNGENILSNTRLYVAVPLACCEYIKIQRCAHADPSDVIRVWVQVDMYIYGNMTKMAAFLVQGLTSSVVYLV